MRKSIYLLILILLTGCSSQMLNVRRYKGSEKIVYEKMFVGKYEVTDRVAVDRIVELIGTAQRGPAKFVVEEQLFFIKNGDTLTIRKSGASLQTVDGAFQLGEQAEDTLMKLLGVE